MANKGIDNLIPTNQRTEDELREMTKNGGIKSGQVRREKANFRKALDLVLKANISDKKMKQTLESMGFDQTHEMAITLSMVQKAAKGDAKAAAWVSGLVHANKLEVTSDVDLTIKDKKQLAEEFFAEMDADE